MRQKWIFKPVDSIFLIYGVIQKDIQKSISKTFDSNVSTTLNERIFEPGLNQRSDFCSGEVCKLVHIKNGLISIFKYISERLGHNNCLYVSNQLG